MGTREWLDREFEKSLDEVKSVSDAELADMWEAVQGEEDEMYEAVAAEIARRQGSAN